MPSLLNSNLFMSKFNCKRTESVELFQLQLCHYRCYLVLSHNSTYALGGEHRVSLMRKYIYYKSGHTMSIPYNSYIHEKLDVDKNANNIFLKSSRSKRFEEFDLIYSVNPSIERLNNQAELFSKYLIGNKDINLRLNISRTDFEGVKNELKQAYIYSYLKTLFYCIKHNDDSNFRISSNSNYVFYGHAMLYKTAISGFTKSSNLSTRSVMTRSFSLYTELDSQLRASFQMYKDCSDGRAFYSSTLEHTLSELSKSGPDLLNIVDLSDPDFFISNSPEHNPIGNCCFSESHDELFYLPIDEVDSDRASFFWNTACCINILKDEVLDRDNKFYNSLDVKLIDTYNYNYEVYSITGFMPEGFTDSDDGNFSYPTGNNNYDTNPPTDDPVNPNNGRPSNSGGKRNNGNNSNNRRRRSNSPFRKSKINKAVISIVTNEKIIDILTTVTKGMLSGHITSRQIDQAYSKIKKLQVNRESTASNLNAGGWALGGNRSKRTDNFSFKGDDQG